MDLGLTHTLGNELPELDYVDNSNIYGEMGTGFDNNFQQPNYGFQDKNEVNFVCLDDLRETQKSENTVGYTLGSMAQYADTNMNSNLNSVEKSKYGKSYNFSALERDPNAASEIVERNNF